ncbi:AsmA family protein [Stappia indica]|nr:AsmA family protein [Stappia indica]
MILALLAALVGPFFIDWTAYRTTFETYGEQMLGHKVAVMGEAQMRLLPTPTLTFSDVRVGAPEDPLLAVSRFEVRIELPPLLKGELRIIDMHLDKPELTLSLDEQGRLDWFTGLGRQSMLSSLDPDQVMLEQVDITDGSVTVIDARSGRSHRVDDIDILVAARSLLGPYKIDGTARFAGERATVMMATGRRDEAGAVRLRTRLTPISVPLDLIMDGRLSQDGGRPAYEGSYALTSVTPEEEWAQAWKSEGTFTLDVAALNLTEASLRYGPDERPMTLEGRLGVALTAPYGFDVQARAKQVDLDRMAGRGPQEPLAVPEAGRLLLSALRALPHPSIPGRVRLDVPALVAGGGLAQDMRIDAERLASGWRLRELSGRLPGRSEVLLRGDLELQPAPAFRGSFAAAVAQPNAFADWWRHGVALDAAVDPFAVESRVSASEGGFALTDLTVELGADALRGAVSYTAADSGAPAKGAAKLEADLDADRLNSDQVALLAQVFLDGEDGVLESLHGAATQFALRLFAQEVRIEDFTAKTVALRAAYEDDRLTIDELTVSDLAGANLIASGEVEALSQAPSGQVKATVDARRMSGVAALLETLFPEAQGLRRFTRRAAEFSPAKLELDFTGEASGSGGGAQSRVTLTARGNAGGTEVDVSAGLTGRIDRWDEAKVDFEAGFTAADGGRLLAQTGVTVLPVASLGEARLELGAGGIPEDGLDGYARLYLGGASLEAVGRVVLPRTGAARYSADVVARAEDLLPLTLVTGRLPSLSSSAGTVDLAMGLKGAGDTFELTGISGSVAGVRVDGALQMDLRRGVSSAEPRVRGQLDLSDLDLAGLSDLVLGADQFSAATSGAWPEAAFTAPILPAVDIAVDVTARTADLGVGPEASQLTGRLSLKNEALTLDISEAGFAGGQLSGSYGLTRSGGQAGLTASLRLEGAVLEDLIWRRGGRPVATGRFDLALRLEGAGRSVAGIVASLSGGGTVKVGAGEIRGLNPEAFGLVIRAVDAGLDVDDATVREAFASHLDTGRLGFDALEGSFSVAGGVVRISNVTLDNADGDTGASVFGSAQVDLEEKTLQSDFALKVEAGEEAVTGAEPEVGLVFSGDLAAPSRTIDITPFTAFLTLRAFEQEVRRVEELQAEITERDRLMRELRRAREEKRRREREEAERALAPAPAPAEASDADQTAPADAGAAVETEKPEARQPEAGAVRPLPPKPIAADRGRTPDAPQQPDFGSRIRRALEAVETPARAGADKRPGQPMQLLPPLEPPVFIDVTPDR